MIHHQITPLMLPLLFAVGVLACNDEAPEKTPVLESNPGLVQSNSCDVANPSCPNGEECWFASVGEEVALQCVPDSFAAADEGSACTVKLGQSDCPPGLVCFADSGTAGKCKRPCSPDGSPSCEAHPSEQCTPYQPFAGGSVVHVCLLP